MNFDVNIYYIFFFLKQSKKFVVRSYFFYIKGKRSLDIGAFKS